MPLALLGSGSQQPAQQHRTTAEQNKHAESGAQRARRLHSTLSGCPWRCHVQLPQ